MAIVSLDYLNSVLPTSAPTDALCAQDSSGTAMTLAISIPYTIPVASVYNQGFTDNGNNTFTAGTTGVYRITYSLDLAAAVACTVEVAINSTAVPSLTQNVLAATSSVFADSIVSLATGDIVSLTATAPAIGVLTLSAGVGAILSVVQLG